MSDDELLEKFLDLTSGWLDPGRGRALVERILSDSGTPTVRETMAEITGAAVTPG
jgi:hypothetical protein